jgi:hemin uptake protein HemP
MKKQVEAQQDEPQVLRSENLLRGAREVTIRHAGEVYRLRITSNDKLILTK